MLWFGKTDYFLLHLRMCYWSSLWTCPIVRKRFSFCKSCRRLGLFLDSFVRRLLISTFDLDLCVVYNQRVMSEWLLSPTNPRRGSGVRGSSIIYCCEDIFCVLTLSSTNPLRRGSRVLEHPCCRLACVEVEACCFFWVFLLFFWFLCVFFLCRIFILCICAPRKIKFTRIVVDVG